VSPDSVLDPVSGSTGSCSSCFSFLDGVSAALFFCSVVALDVAAAAGDATAGGVVEGGDSSGVLSGAGDCAGPGVEDAGASGIVAGGDTVCACSGMEMGPETRKPAEITIRYDNWHRHRDIRIDYPLNRLMPIPTMHSAIATVDVQPSQ
jgi:hypothetical protein